MPPSSSEAIEIRPMCASDRGAVLDLLEHAFHQRELFERYMDFDPAFRYADFWLACEDGRPVSSVQVFTKTIRLRHEEVLLGGIGSVATHESQRGKGGAQADAAADGDALHLSGLPPERR